MSVSPGRRVDREGAEQCALVAWAALQRLPGDDEFVGDYLVHIPNGGRMTARQGARLKKMGVKAGTADLLLALPSGKMHGLWVEMKAPKPHPSNVSAAQRAFLRRMKEQDYEIKIAYGWLEARAAILHYLRDRVVGDATTHAPSERRPART